MNNNVDNFTSCLSEGTNIMFSFSAGEILEGSIVGVTMNELPVIGFQYAVKLKTPIPKYPYSVVGVFNSQIISKS